MSTLPEEERSLPAWKAEEERAWSALAERVTESMRLEKLSNRELVFQVKHSCMAGDTAVEEMMMTRLFSDWADMECGPDCMLCKQEAGRG